MSTLLCLVLLAPGGKLWSKAHDIGIWFPPTWKVTATDQGRRAFVVEGPHLGSGQPRAVLWNAGPADAITLKDLTKKLVAGIKGRAGWHVTVQQAKRVGCFPAIRIGIRFNEKGAKGRARFTVAWMGGNYYVLELSAPASHFPGSVFDRIEQSLAVSWTEYKLDKLIFKLPPGWSRLGAGRFRGPRAAQFMVMAEPEPAAPPDAKPGARVMFLGEKRATHTSDQAHARLLLTHARGYSAGIILPLAEWDVMFPVAEEILKRARLAAPAKKK